MLSCQNIAVKCLIIIVFFGVPNAIADESSDFTVEGFKMGFIVASGGNHTMDSHWIHNGFKQSSCISHMFTMDS